MPCKIQRWLLSVHRSCSIIFRTMILLLSHWMLSSTLSNPQRMPPGLLGAQAQDISLEEVPWNQLAVGQPAHSLKMYALALCSLAQDTKPHMFTSLSSMEKFPIRSLAISSKGPGGLLGRCRQPLNSTTSSLVAAYAK